jgi:hypothetical protein
MKQDENEQNYTKGSTPVVGKKPYGKPQSKCIGIPDMAPLLGIILRLATIISGVQIDYSQHNVA